MNDTQHAISELVAEAQRTQRPLSQAAVDRFEIYLDTLLFWRRRLSLTTAASPVGIVRSHIIDSLFVAPLVQPGFRVADVGSGAGFPGLPLAIACEATLSLVEANRKKANFLREVVRRARLSNVEVIEERAEHLATTRAEAYQLVVSRALWRVPQFLRASQPLLRSGGLAVAMKGPRGSEEAGCRWPSFSEPEVMPYQLKGNVRRMLLVYRKIDPHGVR